MAHVKAGGTTKGNRDSRSKRLGVKKYGGEVVRNGNILIRQKGTKVSAGDGVKMGKDFTLYAIKSGTVQFSVRRAQKYISVED